MLFCSLKANYDKIVNDLNREIDAQRSKLQDQAKPGATSNGLDSGQKPTVGKGAKSPGTPGGNLPGSQKDDNRQDIIRLLADIRGDLVKITEGNLKAMNEDERLSLSIQALITSKTAQLQEKIDDYERQIENLKRELKTQKTSAQRNADEAADARRKLGILQKIVV